MKQLHIALVYNGSTHHVPDSPEDRGSTSDLQSMIRLIARTLRRLGHTLTLLPLADDLFAFQRKLRRLCPDVVFNQYEDFIPGASSDMRLVAVVRMMGFPVTGASALALGLSHQKFTVASLLAGAGIPIPPNTSLLETIGAVDDSNWQFPIIVQPSQEHAGVGLSRDSVVHSKKALRLKVREILQTFHQPALVQHFLPGREFNVGIIGGRRMRVLPLDEVNYTLLPPEIPPIMSYAAKWLETAVEYQKTSVICPAQVDSALEAEISGVALRSFRAVDGWGYGRVDVRLDDAGSPCVLDVNCNPCLDEGMGLARSAEKAGISYAQLLQLVVQAALEHPPYSVEEPTFTSQARLRKLPQAAKMAIL
jgi:D-alanine-D-alanine ligase